MSAKKGGRTSGLPVIDLPANTDAERLVLGAILLDDSVYTGVAAILHPEDFSLDKHRKIYRRMGDLAQRDERIDRVTVAHELQRHDELEACDGLSYLVSLDDGLPRLPNVDSYARIVADKSCLRKIIYTSQGMIARATMSDAEPDSILSLTSQGLMNLATDRTTIIQGPQTIADIVENYPGGLNGLCGAGLKAQGLQTGFVRLDNLTGGLQPGELTVLAGRPSMGKTAIALDIARYVAGHHFRHPESDPQGVAIFSLEMTKEALMIRMICQDARINSYAFRADVLTRDDRAKIAVSTNRLTQLPIYIDDRSGITVPDIYIALKRLIAANHPIRLCVIDYLGLITPTERVDNRALEVGYLMKGLKRIAKELHIPVMVLAQLSRACESRQDKRPILSDLRESGDIEQDCDVAAFVFREEVYKPDRDDLKGNAELLIRKQRNGPLGTVELVYLAPFTRFENKADDCGLPHGGGGA